MSFEDDVQGVPVRFDPLRPLGPHAAEHLPRDIGRHFFSPVEAIFGRPEVYTAPFVLGRRGSGKTVVLNSTASLSMELETTTVFTAMAQTVNELQAAGNVILIRTVAEIWDIALLVAVAHELLRTNKIPTREAASSIRTFLEGLVPDPESVRSETLVAAFCRHFRAQALDTSNMLLADLDSFTSGAVKFQTLRRLLSEEQRVVVLLDSLEDFDTVMQLHEQTIAGLLQHAGRDVQFKQRFHSATRVAIPSELYDVVSRLSGNPLKDLSSQLVIDWNAKDLLRLAADRINVGTPYLNSSEGPQSTAFTIKYQEADFVGALSTLLPSTLVNRQGVTEPTIAYILRHTQLLPRHIIIALNLIFRESGGLTDLNVPVREDAVVTGMQMASSLLCTETCVAHRALASEVDTFCTMMLPSIGCVFSQGAFHMCFNRAGVQRATGKSFEETTQILMDVGVVGIVTDETQTYAKARFNYNLAGIGGRRLLVSRSADDTLCIHPMFSETYNSRYERDSRTAVYPSGTFSGD